MWAPMPQARSVVTKPNLSSSIQRKIRMPYYRSFTSEKMASFPFFGYISWSKYQMSWVDKSFLLTKHQSWGDDLFFSHCKHFSRNTQWLELLNSNMIAVDSGCKFIFSPSNLIVYLKKPTLRVVHDKSAMDSSNKVICSRLYLLALSLLVSWLSLRAPPASKHQDSVISRTLVPAHEVGTL